MRRAAWMVSLCLLVLAAGAARSWAAAPPPVAQPGAAADESASAWLGVYLQSVTDELREGLKLPRGGGVLVSQVVEDGPAQEAGIQGGDVILRFDKKTVASASELTELVGDARSGSRVSVVVWRDGKEREVQVKLGKRPPAAFGRALPGMPQLPDVPGVLPPGFQALKMLDRDEGPRLGVRVNDLNPDLAGYFDLPDARGALVLEVLPDSPASAAGLKAGDVIRKLGGETVEGAAGLAQAASKTTPGQETQLQLRRKGKDLTLAVTLQAPPPGPESRKLFQSYRSDASQGCAPRPCCRPSPGCRHRSGGDHPGFGRDFGPVELHELRQEMESLRREMEELKSRLKG